MSALGRKLLIAFAVLGLAASSTATFVHSGGARSVPVSKLPARAVKDLGVLVATPVALVITLIFVAGASWGMSAFPRAAERPAAVLPPAISAAQRAEFERWWDVQPKS